MSIQCFEKYILHHGYKKLFETEAEYPTMEEFASWCAKPRVNSDFKHCRECNCYYQAPECCYILKDLKSLYKNIFY